MSITYTPQYSLLATVTNSGVFAVQVSSSSVTNLVSTVSTVTNAGIFAVQITSLPAFAVGSTVSVTNLVSTTSTVTNVGTFAVQVTSLPAFAVGSMMSMSNGAIVSVSAYTISVTNAGVSYTPVYKYLLLTNTTAVPIWTPAVGKSWVMTDFHFNTTTGTTLTIQESGTAANVNIMKFTFVQNGGAVSNLTTPIKAVQTNTPLLVTITTTSATGLVCGYEQ